MHIGQVAPDQISALREMMREYLEWSLTLDPNSRQAPTFSGMDDELENPPGIFAPPKGRFLVASEADQILGAVALKPVDEGTAELKRLYVRPEARGKNVGVQLVKQLVDDARSEGYKRIILDSHKSMSAAHAIYRKVGFVDVDPWPGFPEALVPVVVFMEMRLT